VIADFSELLLDGPWEHRFVSANGARFHVAVAGPEGAPLVVLLHSFPQMWWAWRHQVPALAAAGYRVAALDLRGFGASDKPPLGYDLPNLSRDVAGVIRTLGSSEAVVVGHGLGAMIAWSMPTLQPAVTTAVAALSAPHPAHIHVSMRASLTAETRRRVGAVLVPNAAERRLRRTDVTAQLLRAWSTSTWTTEELDAYRTAMSVPSTAHSSLETVRWLLRNRLGTTYRTYVQTVRGRVRVPVLQLQGTRDGCVEPTTAAMDSVALCSQLRFEQLDGAGHFLAEERPDDVNEILLDWLDAAFSTPPPVE